MESNDSDDPAYYLQGEKVSGSADELCKRLLFTCYMGSENSSEQTRELAEGLATDINANFSRFEYFKFSNIDFLIFSILIDDTVSALLDTLRDFTPSYDVGFYKKITVKYFFNWFYYLKN